MAHGVDPSYGSILQAETISVKYKIYGLHIPTDGDIFLDYIVSMDKGL